MNTIFIFNDSRPTDDFRAVMALGEDGQCIARITFDSLTHRHCQFAMGVVDVCTEDDVDVSGPVYATRAAVMRRYDETYGAMNWMALWLDKPDANPDCRDAIHRLRERHRQSIRGATIVPISFSNEALAGILRAVFGEAAATPHTTH